MTNIMAILNFFKHAKDKSTVIKKTIESLNKLRNLGREQIIKRMKMKEENLDLPNDMLTLFLKEKSKFKFYRIVKFLKLGTYSRNILKLISLVLKVSF
jgi:hypothetical protein